MTTEFRTGERIFFRPLEVEDLETCQSWFNDPENHQYLTRGRPLSREEEREWLERQHQRPGEVVFGVALREGGRLIGSCGLHRIEPPHRSAELGILIGDRQAQGKRYGREAIGLLLDYGFATLNLNRVELRVYANNLRGIRCYEGCGFTREGVRREARWWGGRWWDVLEYAILAREWATRTPSPGTAT